VECARVGIELGALLTLAHFWTILQSSAYGIRYPSSLIRIEMPHLYLLDWNETNGPGLRSFGPRTLACKWMTPIPMLFI
jgi:hypothetical protein